MTRRLLGIFLSAAIGLFLQSSPAWIGQAAADDEGQASVSASQPAGGSGAVATTTLGKKKRIAVMRFESTAKFGGGDVGEGLSAMLSNELLKTGRFVVLERAALGDIIGEQQLGAKGLATPESSAKMGKLQGAQILVRGTVTDFEAQRGGGGGQFSISGIGSIPVGLTAGGAGMAAEVAIDLRLIDATTGEVIDTYRAKGKAKAASQNVAFQHTGTGIGFGTEQFQKTPLGQAALKAIQECVTYVISKTDAIPWAGRVSEVSGDKIYLNAGADAGLIPGDALDIFAIEKEIKDPETGAILGVEERRIGSLQVESVQPKFSIARRTEGPPPQAGDIVRARGYR